MAVKKKRKKRRKPTVGVALYGLKDGRLVLMARGRDRAGKRHTIAFETSPGEVIEIAARFLRGVLPHAQQCGACSDDVANLVDEIDEAMTGVFEAPTIEQAK